MSESPYDAYPYPEPGRYPPDQIKNLRIDTAPRRETWAEWFPGEDEPSPKKVLVIGCGVYEAIAVAAQEPLLEVVGIDASSNVISAAMSIAIDANIGNLRLFQMDFMERPLAQTYDIICASGVLHHVRDRLHFVSKVSPLLNRNGLFVVMVYGDQYREFVPPFCEMLKTLGVKRDANGIAFVRGLIAALPDHHPIKQFYANVTDYDAQIADLWLHPYFHQYQADELLRTCEISGLRFQRWLNPATDYSLLENLPPRHFDIARRFGDLPYESKCRMGQILNHADLKLSAVFKKAA